MYREATPEGGVNAIQRAFVRGASKAEFENFVKGLGLSDGDLLFVGERFDHNTVSTLPTKLD